MLNEPAIAGSINPPSKAAALLRSLQLSSGAREFLKWSAAALMLVDHINAYVFTWSYPWMHGLGRLVFPLFGFVLAYNLIEHSSPASFKRVLWRLAVFGLLAQPFSMALRKTVMPTGDWWQLNILFSFVAALLILELLRARHWAAWLVAAAAIATLGTVVEFHWFGIAFVLASFFFLQRRTPASFGLWLLSCASLGLDNGTMWALAAVPSIWVACRLGSIEVKRVSWWWFYSFYVVHLAGIWLFLKWSP